MPIVLILFVTCSFFPPPAAHAETVNIEKQRKLLEGKEGFSLQGQASANIIQGNIDLFVFGLGAMMAWKDGGYQDAEPWKREHLLFAQYAQSIVLSSSDTLAEVAMLHLRWTYMPLPWFGGEVFTQGRHNRNWKLDLRWLTGGGARLLPLRTQTFQLALGVGAMADAEWLRLNANEPDSPRSLYPRGTSYVALQWEAIPEHLRFFYVTYYQPNLTNWAEDYRLSADLTFEVLLSPRFSFTWGLDLQYDSQPPTGIRSIDWRLSPAFVVRM